MFNLNEAEEDSVDAFIGRHRQCKCRDAMCQKFEYRFYPGSLGTSVIIKCLVCGEEENVTDFDCW